MKLPPVLSEAEVSARLYPRQLRHIVSIAPVRPVETATQMVVRLMVTRLMGPPREAKQ